ncbi:MAG: hypothetical protein ACK55I_22075, partial [bacterium]
MTGAIGRAVMRSTLPVVPLEFEYQFGYVEFFATCKALVTLVIHVFQNTVTFGISFPVNLLFPVDDILRWLLVVFGFFD